MHIRNYTCRHQTLHKITELRKGGNHGQPDETYDFVHCSFSAGNKTMRLMGIHRDRPTEKHGVQILPQKFR